MSIGYLVRDLPPWFFYGFTLIWVFTAVFVGFGLGATLLKQEHAKDAPIGSVVGATLGLLAFILAFTFGAAANRFDARKQLLLDEVNAIGTAYLRSDFLAASLRVQAQTWLRQYVALRLKSARNPQQVRGYLEKAESIQTQLWRQMRQQFQQGDNSPALALYAAALNDMFDLQTKRATVALQYHVPEMIWLVLYLVTFLSMVGVGLQFRLSGSRSLMVVSVLALSFSAVIALIGELDRSNGGLLVISQQPMLKLAEDLTANKAY